MARMWSSGSSRTRRSASGASASSMCSQLSKIRSTRRPRRNVSKPGRGSCVNRPSVPARTQWCRATSLASLSAPKSTKKTCSPRACELRDARPRRRQRSCRCRRGRRWSRSDVAKVRLEIFSIASIPPDHLGGRRGQGARRGSRCRLDGRGRRFGTGEGGGKAITATGDVDDISGARRHHPKGLAQARDVEAEAALVDIHIGPDLLDKVALVHDLAGDVPRGKSECRARARRDEAERRLSPTAAALGDSRNGPKQWPNPGR